MEAQEEKLPCIYTEQSVAPDDFALNHYVPWAFVMHDCMWNLAPVSVLGNAEKSDNLPDNAAYSDAFVELQFMAVNALHDFPNRERWEDLFDSYSTELNLDVIGRVPDKATLHEALLGTVGPLVSMAGSRGFSSHWKFIQRNRRRLRQSLRDRN